MRNHILSKMTANEVEEYLDRGGDTVFIAVGVIECHGTLPIDCEAVGPEAFAVALAEKHDAVAMIDLPYFYPGGTYISSATVHMPVQTCIKNLTKICESLVEQGFKKLILVSGHGPAALFISAFARDFFEKHFIHPCHIDCMTMMMKAFGGDLNTARDKIDKVVYGQYKYMGMMEYLPIYENIQEERLPHKDPEPELAEFAKCVREYGGFSPVVCTVYSDHGEHGGGRVLRSEQERLQVCTEGEKYFREVIDTVDLTEYLRRLDDYQKYAVKMRERFPRIGKI